MATVASEILDRRRATMIQDYEKANLAAKTRRHVCPVCGEISECQNIGDNYHSCGLCGSIWQSNPFRPW